MHYVAHYSKFLSGLLTSIQFDAPQLLPVTLRTEATWMFSGVQSQQLLLISHRCVCRQVAGKEFTQWDHFHVDGRRAGGGQEMTLEDLIRRIKVARERRAEVLHTRRV